MQPNTLELLMLCRRSVVLVSRRWNRVLYSTPSIWRSFSLGQPPSYSEQQNGQWQVVQLQQWPEERQRDWLSIKLQQLRRVAPVVRHLHVEFHLDTALAVEVLPSLLRSAAGSQLITLCAWGLNEPVSPAAMQALASLAQLQKVELGHEGFDLPSNCGWALAQLPQLDMLDLTAQQFSGELLAAIAGMTLLEELQLESSAPLPRCSR